MKTHTVWSAVLILYCFVVTPLFAGNPYVMPKWVAYYNQAVLYYQSGVSRVSDDPAAAIKSLTKAREFDSCALAAGGGQYAGILSDLNSKAMQQANSNLNKPQPKPKPTQRPVLRKKAPPVKISNNGRATFISR